MKKNYKPLKRLSGWVVVSDHPVKTGCCPNSDSIQIEITPCFNRVSTGADLNHQLLQQFLDGEDNPMNRIGGFTHSSNHPDKSGYYPKKRNVRIETTPCFSMVAESIHKKILTASAVYLRCSPHRGG